MTQVHNLARWAMKRRYMILAAIGLLWLTFPLIHLFILVVLEVSTEDVSVVRFGRVADVEVGDSWDVFLKKIEKETKRPYLSPRNLSTGGIGPALRLDQPLSFLEENAFEVVWYPESPPNYVQGYIFSFQGGKVHSVSVMRRYLEPLTIRAPNCPETC